MVDSRHELERALDAANRARDEAERLREQAKRMQDQAGEESKRLRDQAREEAKRMRDQAREEAKRLRDQAREEARRLRDEARRAGQEERSRDREARLRGRRDAMPVGNVETDPAGVRSEQLFAMEGVRQIAVDSTAGKVIVRRCSPGEQPGVVSTGSKTSPEMVVKRDGDRLIVEVKLAKGWLFRRRQGGTTVVRLDETEFSSIRVDNGYGETELNGVSAGELRVSVGAGSVQCIQTRGRLDVNVGAGKIAVLAHAGLARADSGTGDVLLDVAELVPGEYKVDVGLGRAEVRLPAGQRVMIRATSGMGKTRLEYPSAGEDAETRVKIASGIGEVVVKAREGAAAGTDGVSPAGQPRPQRGSRAATERRRESEELRVLQLLEQGKITPQDAADLIAALRGSTAPRFDDDEDDGRD